MLNRRLIADLLHKMDKGKRLEANVTEVVLRRTYGASQLSSDATYSWMVTKADDKSPERKYAKDWFIVARSISEVAKSAAALIRAFEKKSFQFFALTDVTVNPTDATLEFKVNRLYLVGDVVKGSVDHAITESLIKKINAGILEAKSQVAENTWDIEPYLENLSDNEVVDIFVGRCVMDLGLNFPIDVDAVDVKGSRPVVYEFKRKDPSKTYYLDRNKVPMQNFGPCIKRVKAALSKIPERLTKDLIHEVVVRELNATKHEGECFGLDYYSHVENLITCSFVNVDYQYVIWNRTREAVHRLVAHDFTPIGSFNLIHAKLHIRDIRGFHFTDPPQSGDVQTQRKVRMQAMIPAERFRPVIP